MFEIRILYYVDTIEKIAFTQKDIDRFWSKYKIINDCWIWQAGKSLDGYGKVCFNKSGKYYTCRAHRVAYFLNYNKIDKNLAVCHRCDQPLCINPEHLFLGTIQDNHDDMRQKGRQVQPRGEQLSNLTASQVLEIRQLVKNGEKQIDVARKFNIGKNAIWYIVRRDTWKHL